MLEKQQFVLTGYRLLIPIEWPGYQNRFSTSHVSTSTFNNNTQLSCALTGRDWWGLLSYFSPSTVRF